MTALPIDLPLDIRGRDLRSPAAEPRFRRLLSTAAAVGAIAAVTVGMVAARVLLFAFGHRDLPIWSQLLLALGL